MGPDVVEGILSLAALVGVFGAVFTVINLHRRQWSAREEATGILAGAQRSLVRALQERHDHAVSLKYDDVMAIEPEPEGSIKAWTPLEREAFGINETIALIDRIERELDPPPVDSERLYARGGYVPL